MRDSRTAHAHDSPTISPAGIELCDSWVPNEKTRNFVESRLDRLTLELAAEKSVIYEGGAA
jgi:hypothetical protein